MKLRFFLSQLKVINNYHEQATVFMDAEGIEQSILKGIMVSFSSEWWVPHSTECGRLQYYNGYNDYKFFQHLYG